MWQPRLSLTSENRHKFVLFWSPQNCHMGQRKLTGCQNDLWLDFMKLFTPFKCHTWLLFPKENKGGGGVVVPLEFFGAHGWPENALTARDWLLFVTWPDSPRPRSAPTPSVIAPTLRCPFGPVSVCSECVLLFQTRDPQIFVFQQPELPNILNVSKMKCKEKCFSIFFFYLDLQNAQHNQRSVCSLRICSSWKKKAWKADPTTTGGNCRIFIRPPELSARQILPWTVIGSNFRVLMRTNVTIRQLKIWGVWKARGRQYWMTRNCSGPGETFYFDGGGRNSNFPKEIRRSAQSTDKGAQKLSHNTKTTEKKHTKVEISNYYSQGIVGK